MHVDHASPVKKVCGWIFPVWPSWVRESQHISIENSVSWTTVIAVDQAFIAGHQSIITAGSELISSTISLLSWQHLSFWSSLSTLGTNFAQIFRIFSSSRYNCVYSSETDIRLCTYCLYRHTTVLIHEILYLAHQPECSDFLTPPTPLLIPHRLPAFLEYLMLLKNWFSIYARLSKSSLKISICSCVLFSNLKQNFMTYRSSKVSSRPGCIFENHQLWQSGFSRLSSTSCCSCSFEPEIIIIGQSFYEMYSNNIVNFQGSTTILNPCTKKAGSLLNAPRNSFT